MQQVGVHGGGTIIYIYIVCIYIYKDRKKNWQTSYICLSKKDCGPNSQADSAGILLFGIFGDSRKLLGGSSHLVSG